MSFEKDINKAIIPFYSIQEQENLHFECGLIIEEYVVRYDGYNTVDNIKSIYMHQTCAASMAQRLIVDGFPNRRK